MNKNKKTNHHISKSKSKNKNKNKTIKNKNIISNNIIESDILCIGAGVSSAYMCYQLKEQCGIKSKINVIESEPILGGRLKSEYTNLYSNNKGVVYDELGGMRLFKDESMKKIFDLLKKFKLDYVDVSLEDKNDIFYYKGKIFNKNDVKLSNGMTIQEFEEFAIHNLKKKYPNYKNENVYNYEEIRDMNIIDFFKKFANANNNDIDLWKSYSGYDFLSNNIQVSIWLFDKDYYTSKNSKLQKYVKTGMVSLVQKLFEHSNVNISYNTKAIYIEKDINGLNLVHTINNLHQYKCYKSKYLILGVTPNSINELNIINPLPISKDRLFMVKQVTPLPLFKCFLKWDKDKIWWGKGKLNTSGKSVTDLMIRQVHYYNDEDILIYNSGKYATELYNKFFDNPAQAAKYVYSCIQKMHPFYIPEPNYVYTLYKYWPYGSPAWNVSADVDLYTKIIPNGNIDYSNIYIIGDSYSKYQGWVLGALNSVDIAYPLICEKYKDFSLYNI